MENIAKAAELFASGLTINGVAKRLGITWEAARKLKRTLDINPNPALEQALEEAVPGDADTDPEAWEVTLRIPVGRVDDIFLACNEQEKITAVQGILQTRMNAALGIAG